VSATLTEALRGAWQKWPDRPALAYRGRNLTYRELQDATEALAAGYATLGIEPGDRIVCSVSNRPEYLVALGAAWLCGAVHVGIDFGSTPRELSQVLGATGARALVCEPTTPLDSLLEEHCETEVIVIGEERPASCHGLVELSELGGALPAHKQTGEDPALIFISSGTTGTPKATIGWHGNLAGRWTRLGGWLGFRSDDVHLVQLPLSHGFGLLTAMAGLLSGGTLAPLDRFSTDGVLTTISDEHVTVFNGAPAHFRLVLDRLDQRLHDVSSLRLSIGTAAAFSPELVAEIRTRLGVDMVVMYGSSEGIGIATKDQDDILLGAVGRPAPESVAVVAPDHTPLPVGEIGELAFSRAVFPVRYWDEESSNGQEWYYSGDLGRLDAEGRLYLHGRLKHQIDRGGLKVDPVEVEAALLRRDDLRDAAVIGVPNPVLGESVCACVVPHDGKSPTLEELRAQLANELAPYKLPESLCLLESIPRTALGKVALEELFALAST
jgi:acyl-CoA synthetase (AMP-forming)/AMP-acid ligase II